MPSQSRNNSQPLSPDQRRRRAQALASAYGSLRIEGLEPTPEGRRLHLRWVDGHATADEIVAQLIDFHVRADA